MTRRATRPAAPKPFTLDRGVAKAVEILRAAGIETCQSCEGGKGHAYPEPTVDFRGTPEAGWRALSACIAHGLPVSELRRVWSFENNEPVGPLWAITFRERVY